MIRPVRFEMNAQTIESNAFQKEGEKGKNIQQMALDEFNSLVDKLLNHNVNVIVFEDSPDPHTPDSIFPNNWVSFHEDGTVVLYPMMAPNRREERRGEILEGIEETFTVNKLIDLSDYERENKFLEGTGSLVMDRHHKIAYVSLSERSNEELIKMFGEKFHYKMVIFNAVDRQGKDIYHTNVVMCVGEHFAVICEDCIKDEGQKQNVLRHLVDSGKEIISINYEQMENFAGNMLNIKNKLKESLVVMSERACQSLLPEQIKVIEKYAKIITANLDVIEKAGGGSARCMIAEVFLPKIS